MPVANPFLPDDDTGWSAQNAIATQNAPQPWETSLKPYEGQRPDAPAGEVGKELWAVPGRLDDKGNQVPVSGDASGRPRDYKQDAIPAWTEAASNQAYTNRQNAAAAAAANTVPRPAAAAGAGGAAAPGQGDDFSNLIKGYIEKLLSGQDSRFNPKAVAALQNQAVRTAKGQARAQRDKILQNAARTGMFRSPDINPNLMDVERGASTDISTKFQNIQLQKATADIEDRFNSINSGMQWLQSLRNYALGSERNAADKAIAEAQIKLGYANIANQKQMLEMQLSKMGGGGGGGNSTQDAIINQILSSIVK